MGKAEGSADLWHGHVTALTVAPEYRRLGLAAKLMNILEEISEKYEILFGLIINFLKSDFKPFSSLKFPCHC